jgi:hypothetical protein
VRAMVRLHFALIKVFSLVQVGHLERSRASHQKSRHLSPSKLDSRSSFVQSSLSMFPPDTLRSQQFTRSTPRLHSLNGELQGHAYDGGANVCFSHALVGYHI